MQRIKHLFYLFFISSVIIIVVISLLYAQNRDWKEVLVIHSYHYGLGWTDNIQKGIESVLKDHRNNLRIQIEYMDTKRVCDDFYFEKLCEIYKHKFNKRKFDVIISSDDDAFNFLLKYRDDIFGDIPVVFCGIGQSDAEKLLVGHTSFTGIVTGLEATSSTEETAKLIMKLHPNTKRIKIINDYSTSGKIFREAIQNTLSEIEKKINVKFEFLEDLDMSELEKRVSELPKNSAVLMMFYTQDKSGNTFSFDESISLIAEKCNVPIYGIWDFYLNNGIVGGKLSSGYVQGEMSAKIALRLLEGNDITSIPVNAVNSTRWMFDYKQLKRFNIRESLLPKGSIIINHPPSLYDFYKTYRTLIISVISVTIVLSILSINLATNILRRRKAEKELKELNSELEMKVKQRTEQLNSSNEELVRINKELTHELEMAKRVQLSMIPQIDTLPQRKELCLGARYSAMESLGGDLYDIIKVGKNIYSFLIIDVSGHGIPAALITSMAKISFNSKINRETTPSEVCNRVNKEISKLISDLYYYITACYGTLDLETGTFQYVNAGHPPIILYRYDTHIIERLNSNNLFLGLSEDFEYKTDSVQLQEGDRILLFTDGIPEARNKKGEFYGYDRFIDYISKNSHLLPKEFVDNLIKDVENFCGDCPPNDDRAILYIEFVSKSGPGQTTEESVRIEAREFKES